MPLASGEHEPNEAGYLDLILTGCRGLRADGRRAARAAIPLRRRHYAEIASQGLRFAFHSWGTALEVVAAAHLGICWPETVVEWLEYPCYSTSA